MKNLIADCNVQLGDNPNYFKEAAYIGYTLEIPVHIGKIDESVDTISIIISTSVIETLAGDGHFVMINDQIIGRLKDVTGKPFETTIIPILKETFKQLISPNNFMLLKIRIDIFDSPGSGFLDDFIIKKIEIENAEASTMKIP